MEKLNRQGKKKAFDYLYSNLVLRYFQNWGHNITEHFLQDSKLVLDLGAGTGEHQNHANTEREYIAIDNDLDALSIGREDGRNRICLQGTALALPFASGSFDGVVSVYNLEHLQDLERCSSEIVRVLKPGGMLAAAIPTEGLLFSLGRRLVTAPFAVKEMGFNSIKEYEDFVRQEHINSVYDITLALGKFFSIEKKRWFPFSLGGKSLNVTVAIKAIRQ